MDLDLNSNLCNDCSLCLRCQNSGTRPDRCSCALIRNIGEPRQAEKSRYNPLQITTCELGHHWFFLVSILGLWVQSGIHVLVNSWIQCFWCAIEGIFSANGTWSTLYKMTPQHCQIFEWSLTWCYLHAHIWARLLAVHCKKFHSIQDHLWLAFSLYEYIEWKRQQELAFCGQNVFCTVLYQVVKRKHRVQGGLGLKTWKVSCGWQLLQC